MKIRIFNDFLSCSEVMRDLIKNIEFEFMGLRDFLDIVVPSAILEKGTSRMFP